MKDMKEDALLARRIAEAVAAAGGRAYQVGGCVRDLLMGRETKDIDIEVHGITCSRLREILISFGEPVTIGLSFGVYGLKGHELDIAMPRSERAVGRGHRDFEVDVDPFLGTEKACLRRDLTINAMMRDILTGEIIDHVGGQKDLEKGILRHVRAETFVEDPLRVLRTAQFAARFGFAVAPETGRLCAGMDLAALPRERVMEELKKALLRAPRPSVFFAVLRSMDQLGCWFREAADLIGTMQEPRFHPEGDAWDHTMLVLDAAAGMRERVKDPAAFLLAALCHDLGKSRTTAAGPDGRIHSYGHEEAGVPLAEAMLYRLTDEKRLVRYVVSMVRFHMRPNSLVACRAGEKAYMRLFDEAEEPEELLLLSRADALGCGADPLGPGFRAREQYLSDLLDLYRRRLEEPGVTGEDLAAAGFPPGPVYREALGLARRLRLQGMSREEALSQTLGYARTLVSAGEEQNK